jgi:hypothetical protein
LEDTHETVLKVVAGLSVLAMMSPARLNLPSKNKETQLIKQLRNFRETRNGASSKPPI